MIEQVATKTNIITLDSLSAEALDKLIFYCKGEEASPCVIMDNNPLPARDEMLARLKEFREVEVLDRVFPNPAVDDIMCMVTSLRQKEVNVVIGIGGGSSLDSAKGVAAVLSNGGDLDEYLGPDATRKIEKRDVTLILIPTTTGTGSEVTKVGVYTARSGRKYTLGNPLMQADIALLVTDFIKTLPPKLTAATSFDALSHALETLWNKNATPYTDRLATEAAVHILQCIEDSYDSAVSGGLKGRKEMLVGATMAGIAFSITGTAAVHALSFIFSEEWHVPHGVACAFTLEDVYRLNLQDEPSRKRLVHVAERLFGSGDEQELLDKLLDRILFLKKKFGLPCQMGDLNISLSEDRIHELFDKSLDDPKMKNNSVPVTSDIVYNLIKNKL